MKGFNIFSKVTYLNLFKTLLTLSFGAFLSILMLVLIEVFFYFNSKWSFLAPYEVHYTHDNHTKSSKQVEALLSKMDLSYLNDLKPRKINFYG